jgi:hypothetical protein
MKKKFLVLPILLLSLILIFTLLPVSFISASPGNLVKNSSFSDGFNHWDTQNTVTLFNETAYVSGQNGVWTGVYQYVDTSNKHLKYSFDVKAVTFANNGDLDIGFDLWKGPVYLGGVEFEGTITLDQWYHDSHKISELWADQHGGASLPDFDTIEVWVGVYSTAKAYYDNIKLETSEEKAEETWVRTMPMTCYQVWINSDNNFEMVFWYPYRDNNWVKIYDMSGKEVYSVDMPLDDPHIIVDLPNGMYTVKTFNVDPATPIQTFVIGK